MILMIYNQMVCKEFLLPNVYNTDYKILLPRHVFRIQQDTEIYLENLKDGWELVSTKKCSVFVHGEYKERYFLKDKEVVEIKTKSGECMQIISVDVSLCFPVTEKYDLRMVNEISVGKSENNTIRYEFMDLISSVHMILTRHCDGWYLKDTSGNGVFCGNMRVNRERKIQLGDHIEVFGLHMLFLGEILAVSTFYGKLVFEKGKIPLLEFPNKEALRHTETHRQEISYFRRSPRHLPVLYQDSVEIEAPPAPKQIKEKPLLYTIGPAFTMAIPMVLGCGIAIIGSTFSGTSSGAFMYTGLITAVSSAAIGAVWAVLNLKYNKKESLEEESQRFNAYGNYLIQIADSLREKYQHNQRSMLQMYPAAESVLSYNKASSELWNRNCNQEDFLYQRLGLGNQPFQMSIEIPKDKFSLIQDLLLQKPKQIKEEFQTLQNVPIGISLLEKSLIGLVGGSRKQGAIEVMHTLVAGITASHSYTDVKLVFIYREKAYERRQMWECMRWFPHVWSEDKSTRYMASNEVETADVFYELGNIIRRRSQKEHITGAKVVKPHYVLFLSEPELLDGEILAKYVYENRPEYGITTILMVDELQQLPNQCEDVIVNNGSTSCIYNLLDMKNKPTSFIPDKVYLEKLELFGKTLANIYVNEVENSQEIPSTLEFLEMYDAKTLDDLLVEERWRKKRSYHNMKVLIGKKAGGQDCFLDIHEKAHGPHGLVAGTTGSGKSELLQTYILSLAVNFSPEDVSFFIIDFKGGGMAGLFTDLPHLSGQISNLSGNQVSRALVSLKSEKERRERIFHKYGVVKIDSYTKLYKSREAEVPLPHLFIIIDEFAELKKEEPEFMRELISIAQVGRSLGIHLILATQKPNGTVSDDIKSNSRFRLCLRVQDRQDSNDMLHKPDAAYITQAGRCYLRVGNDEILELFQSGYSGAIYREGMQNKTYTTVLLTRTGKAELLGISKKAGIITDSKQEEKTQLNALIEYLSDIAQKNKIQLPHQLWLPVLKRIIYLSELQGYSAGVYENQMWKSMKGKWNLEVYIGLCDDPENQMQIPVSFNFTTGGHHAICGAVVSGKSTFLQTLVYAFIHRYSPDVLQMYLLDFSSHMLAPFEKAPHVGGVIYDTQEDRIAKFMHMLMGMMDERKKKFQGGNYSQYVQAYGVTIPAIVVVLDNYASFREKTKDAYEQIILRLVREGVGYGIYLVMTASGFSSSEIPYRVADNIRTVYALELSDRGRYSDVLRTSRIGVLPEKDTKGRGLLQVDGRILEFQTALSIPAEDDFERIQKLECFCEDMHQHWNGSLPMPIPEIPEKPTLELLRENEMYRSMCRSKEWLPFGYRMEDASIYGIQLKDNYCYCVTGKQRTGKSNTLKMLIYSAALKKGKNYIIEPKTKEFEQIAKETEAEYITDSKALFQFLRDITPEFKRRNVKKQEYIQMGLEDTEIFTHMVEEQPIFIFISDIAEFMEILYKPDAGIGKMFGTFENFVEKGSMHNIYIIGCLNTEKEAALSMYRAYNLLASYKKGIHLGGYLTEQRMFQFRNIPYAQQNKSLKKGHGYASVDEEESCGTEVVIPLAKIRT